MRVTRFRSPPALVATLASLASAPIAAQGPRLAYLTDPSTDLGFASCYLHLGGGSRQRIPFLPVVTADRAPSGTARYTRDVRLDAPIVFVGDGIVRPPEADPYTGLDAAGKFVLLAYDLPIRAEGAGPEVSLAERVRAAATHGAAGVVAFSAHRPTPFPTLGEPGGARIPEIPIIAIDRRAALAILASDGRDPEETLRVWEAEGRFRPGELISKLDLRIQGRFDPIETEHFSFVFEPGIPAASARALADVNERSVGFLNRLFGPAAPAWKKGFVAYFAGYDSKVFYVHHWGKGLSSQAGNFLVFDGAAPDFALAVHENAHALISESWGGSSSFLVEGIGRYAQAMATDSSADDRAAAAALRAGTLFPLVEMSEIDIGSDPRTGVAYPAAGSFVRFLIDRFSMAKLQAVYRAVGSAADARARLAAWSGVYGESLADLDRAWRASIGAAGP